MSDLDQISSERTPGLRSEWRGDGLKTIVGVALAYGSGPFLITSTQSVFVRPVMDATGWTTSDVLIGPIFGIVTCLLLPFAGRFVDRRSLKPVLLTGVIGFVIVAVLFALVPVNKPLYWIFIGLMGLTGAFASMVTFGRAIGLWFHKSAGKAFGLMGAGLSLLPLASVPLAAWAIYGWGWQAGFLVLAAFTLLISLPATLLLIKTPDQIREIQTDAERVAEEIGGAKVEDSVKAKSPLRSPRLWVFALSATLTYGSIAGYASQLQPVLLDAGFSAVAATTVTSFYFLVSLSGRLLAGILLDAFNRYAVVLTMIAVTALGTIATANSALLPPALIVIGVLLIATIQGAEGDIAAFFVLHGYGRAQFAYVYGVVMGFAGIGAVSFPYIMGALRDSTGNYTASSYAATGLFVAAGLCIVVYGILVRRDAAELAARAVGGGQSSATEAT